MRICFIAPASIVHTVRWVNAMVERGHQVDLVTMHQPKQDVIDSRVTVHLLKIPAPVGYYMNRLQANRLIRSIQPDIIHVHFASGYGTLGRFIRFRPIILSVWGSDVYVFPESNGHNKRVLQKNLASATKITSTSYKMKQQTETYITPTRPIDVIPFGIDTALFKPMKQEHANKESLVIGTVKRLEYIYGIDILLRATASLLDMLQEAGEHATAKKIRLMIVGDGSERHAFKQLAEQLGIDEVTTFCGDVENEQVPAYLNAFDVYTALSRSESFGVAVLEASACRLPVVTSRVGGLSEVVRDGETGFMVEHNDHGAIATKLFGLVCDVRLREQMGIKGRQFVEENYRWQDNVSEMEKLYRQLSETTGTIKR